MVRMINCNSRAVESTLKIKFSIQINWDDCRDIYLQWIQDIILRHKLFNSMPQKHLKAVMRMRI